MDPRSLRGVLFAAGSSAAAAAVGSLGARRARQVYDRIERPAWAPPAAVFGPVWTSLYTAVGIAGWRLWNRRAGHRILGLHAAQLAINAAWPITFFALRSRQGAILVITALDAAVAAEIAAAARRDPAAALLLMPYLAWNIFATVLTTSVGDPARTAER